MHRALIFLLATWLAVSADPLNAGSPGMRTYLETRLAENPEDAASHRLLGRLLLEERDVAGAVAHLQIAVKREPLSGAAHFDLGRALHATGDLVGAAAQWRQVLDVAPGTDYARDAETRLAELPPDALGGIETAGYEIREFPGPPGIEPLNDPLDLPAERLPLFVRLETGLLYNSNVALAPSSRQLSPGDRESFQWFVSPEIEWSALSKGDWVAGPMFSGYFTLNEGSFREFNLQSYTPGVFAEGVYDRQAGTLVPRLEYRYSADQFEGENFSQRHAVLGRLTALHAAGGATTGYVSIDQTDFVDDGVLPEVTSADGLNYATGLAHEFDFDDRWLKQFRAGVDLDRLDSRGSDYAYWGAGVTGQAVVPIVPTIDFTLRGGVGYRMYDRYEFEPDRDELIWRAGGELRKWFTPQLSAAAIANYQMFDSNNPLFASDRMIAGLVMEYQY
ncbi:MAG: tetratricopeptide repeat protein [Planctomycetaceae bacterium]